jgi:hypothetical protein
MRLGLKLEQRSDVRRLVDVLARRVRQAGDDLAAAVAEVGEGAVAGPACNCSFGLDVLGGCCQSRCGCKCLLSALWEGGLVTAFLFGRVVAVLCLVTPQSGVTAPQTCLTCAVLCRVQVNSLQTANASLRETLRQTRQQLEGGEMYTQLEAVSVVPGVGRGLKGCTACWVATSMPAGWIQACGVAGCGPCTLCLHPSVAWLTHVHVPDVACAHTSGLSVDMLRSCRSVLR